MGEAGGRRRECPHMGVMSPCRVACGGLSRAREGFKQGFDGATRRIKAFFVLRKHTYLIILAGIWKVGMNQV
jgi:hypothetical protein